MECYIQIFIIFIEDTMLAESLKTTLFQIRVIIETHHFTEKNNKRDFVKNTT